MYIILLTELEHHATLESLDFLRSDKKTGVNMKHTDTSTVYENPIPHLRSRHGYFPGATVLSNGEILIVFSISEAFESIDAFPYGMRSQDSGRTWIMQGPLYDKPKDTYYSEYLKPLLLPNGDIIATGYRMYRENPEQPICNPQTGGFCDSDIVQCHSTDGGSTWSDVQIIPHTFKEMIEASGPCIALTSGRLVGVGALIPAWDGSNPNGPRGVCLMSDDGGKNWGFSYFMEDEVKQIIPFESRLCLLADGTIMALCWAYSKKLEKNLNNHYSLSTDGGKSWSQPVDTGIFGQASNLTLLSDGRLLTVHSHRVDGNGLWVRIIDISSGMWKIDDEVCVFGRKPRSDQETTGQSGIPDQFTSLAYGQPSLLRISDREYLVIHWAVIEGQGKIMSHRILL
jgi:sialidase-1